MPKKLHPKERSSTAKVTYAFILMLCVISLSGCYVDVHPTDTYWKSPSYDVTDYNTALLIDAALVPLALAAESPNMVIDPDAYTTPAARSLSRSAVIETTYAYLFENLDCDYGGSTQAEATANTTSLANGFTEVELTLDAEAFNCGVASGNRVYNVNSAISYDVTGEYDDFEHQLSDLNTRMAGSVSVDYSGSSIAHTNVSATAFDFSSYDFGLHVTSRLMIDNGSFITRTDFTTRSSVHWYLGDARPHGGEVRIKEGNEWVDLRFERSGVQREDSSGYRTFWTWNQLGY